MVWCLVARRQSSAKWWEAEDGEVHRTLLPVIDHLDIVQQWEGQADDFHAEMYAGVRASSQDEYTGSTFDYEPQRVGRNVARSAVDTYVSKVFRHRPLPEVIASKGNWKDQRRARKMTQLIEGQFDRDKVFKKWARVIGRDAGVTGRGILKIDLETLDARRINCERVMPRELRVDRADAKHGDPRNIYLVRDVDAGVLTDRFVGDADEDAGTVEAIKSSAARFTDENDATQQSTVDRCRVVETWHLCDNVDAHEFDEDHNCTGRHVLSIHGADLVDEEWPFQRFPFAILNFLEPWEGFFGVGLCEQLEGYQVEQALMAKKVSDSHYFAGGGIIYVPHGGDLVEEDFTNSVWKVLRGPPGGEPKFFNPEPLHPATYQYLRDIRPDALGDVGLNEMAAGGEKPAGLNSGIAIQSYDEVNDVRLGMHGYQYAQWCVDVAELQLMWIQHIVKKHGDYTSKVTLKGGILELSWSDVAVDNFVVQVHPSALMRMTPSARRQTAEQLFNAHQIDGFTFMRMIDSPDIEGEMDILMAARLKVDEELEAMLDAEDPSDPEAYRPPSPYTTDLEWSMQRTQLRLAQAEMQGCPEGNLELLRDRILDEIDLKAKMNPTPAPMPQPTALPEPGSPEAVQQPPPPVPPPALPVPGV